MYRALKRDRIVLLVEEKFPILVSADDDGPPAESTKAKCERLEPCIATRWPEGIYLIGQPLIVQDLDLPALL